MDYCFIAMLVTWNLSNIYSSDPLKWDLNTETVWSGEKIILFKSTWGAALRSGMPVTVTVPGRALKQVFLCLIYGLKASTRQARGKSEAWICQHQPLPTGIPEGTAGCSWGGTKPLHPEFSWVPLRWLSIAPGRILRSSGQSLHLSSTNSGLQTVSSTNNTKGTTSWIANVLFSWLNLEISSQKARSGQGFCFFCPISK